MNKLMTAQTLGPQLMTLLGMPKNVTSFVLRCAVGEIVTVKCEYHPAEAIGIDTVLAEYELVPRTSAPAAAPGNPVDAMGFDAWMRQRKDAAHRAMMTQARDCIAAGAPISLLSVAPGDKVVLRSGGPEMTVIGTTHDGREVACWWKVNGLMNGSSFDPVCLTRCPA